MSAPDLVIPDMPADLLCASASAAWRAGWLAGYDAALAKADEILQRIEAEGAEGGK